jgi:hypothetical protein
MNPVFLLALALMSCNIGNEASHLDKKKRVIERMNSDSTSLALSDSIKLYLKFSTLTVSYAAIECTCPQWFESRFKDIEYLEGVEKFYLEPQHSGIINANDLWDGTHLPFTVKVHGTFSIQKELPKGYSPKSIPEKARVFVYDSIMVIEPSKSK